MQLQQMQHIGANGLQDYQLHFYQNLNYSFQRIGYAIQPNKV